MAVSDARRLTEGSALVAALSQAERTLRDAADSASSTRAGRKLAQAFDRYWAASGAAAATRQTEQWVRASWLFQWLTAEPETDVIVIDLRETLTVGPFLSILDWLIARFAPWWEGSALATLFRTLDESAEQGESLAERSLVVRGLVALLEPPELEDEQQPTHDGERAEPDADAPEGDPSDEADERADGEKTDDGADGDGEDGRGR